MAVIIFPPETDLEYYKKLYPELNAYSDNDLEKHCRQFAAAQGRSTCAYDRRENLRDILQQVIDKKSLKVLEISPWDDPFVHGDNVKYFEIMDADDLCRATVDVKRKLARLPEKIHFVGKNGDLSVVDETFDIVFSSHVIEHTPDLVEHLRSVTEILKDGGLYIMLIPDKRYCFDYYNPETTISDVLDAFAHKRKIPSLSDVINFVYTRTHNNPTLHWQDFHGERWGNRDKPPVDNDARVEITGKYFFDDDKGVNFKKLADLVEHYAEALKQGQYFSVHNWRFTPEGFKYIVSMLNRLNIIKLPVYRLCHTLRGRCEFVAMLEKV